MRHRAAAAGVAVILLSEFVLAAPAKPPVSPASYGARDPATIECSLFTKMQEKGATGTEFQFFSWAQGYIAGRLAENPNSGKTPLAADGPERVRQYGRMTSYCQTHPAAKFLDAVLDLWNAGA